MNGLAFTMILMIVSSSYGLSKQSDESLRSLNNEFNDNDRDYNRENFGDGDLSDRVVIQSTRCDDPAIWFDQEMPAFQFIHQFTLDNERYIIARIRRSRRKRSINRLQEDIDVSLLRQRSDVKFAIQERAHIRKPKTLDPEWTNLWYLNGEIIPSMRIEEVWNEGYSGQGITVAVLDDGLQTNHPDLAANTDTTNDIDIYGYDNDPYPPSGSSHGTHVGGLIAAVKDNNICTVGVAFNSTLIGVRILGNAAITDSEEAQALSHYRTNVDIYSNSWGPEDGTGFKKPGTLTLAALKDGVTLGRNGKGSIYLFASGNGGTADNCNADGYTNSIYTIAVTSVQIGRNAWYSEVCAAALTAAYGGSEDDKYLTTTSLGSSCGSDGIQGTSYSTPIVSGIIALTLEANNELTWRDVQHLIVWSSSRHNFTDTYSNWTTNGAGKEFSQVMGFGLIDAKEMLDQAKQWKTVPLQQNCSVSSTMPNGATLSDDISVTTNDCTSLQFIEHVTVDVTFSYSRFRGVTQLYLVSPSGTKSHLLHFRYQDAVDNTAAGSLTWQFMSVHFWWENPIGTWNLEIASKDSLSTVSIDAWSIKIYGTETDPRPEILSTTDESSTNGLITTTMKEASTSEYLTSAVLTSESVTTTSDATSRSILLTTTDAKLTSVVESTTSRSFTSFDAESTTSKSKTTSGAESTASGSFTTSGDESTTSRLMTTSAAESTVSRSMTTSGAESSTSGSRTPSGDESTSSRSMTTSGAESSTISSITTRSAQSTTSGPMTTSGAEFFTSRSFTTSSAESTTNRSMTTSVAESSTSRSMTTSGAESTTSGSRTPSGDESTSSRSMTTSGAESSTISSITTRGAQSTTSGPMTTSGAEFFTSRSFTTSSAESTTNRSMTTSVAESSTSRSMTTSGAESTTSRSITTSSAESTTSSSMKSLTTESTSHQATTNQGSDTSQVINQSFDSTTPIEVAATAACIAAVSLICAVISCVLALKAGKKNSSGSLNMKGRNQRSTTPSEIFSNSSLPKHWRSQFNPNNMARYTGHSWD